MSPSEVAACYRLFAAYCVESAQDPLEAGRKIALLDMAQAWSRLAERVEKAARSTVLREQSSRHEQT